MLVFCMSAVASAADYKSLLRGKYLLMEGAGCAGLQIAPNGKDAVMYGEFGCTTEGGVGSDMRLRWIGSQAFVITETERFDETSPPRSYIYVVERVQGKKVLLRAIWTGWNDSPDSIRTYTIK